MSILAIDLAGSEARLRKTSVLELLSGRRTDALSQELLTLPFDNGLYIVNLFQGAECSPGSSHSTPAIIGYISKILPQVKSVIEDLDSHMDGASTHPYIS
ncbi:hypothetical protein FRC12_007009 [Ceratobasidium sp. 428]|nr:hypothetical protein FRC12_007009 [Ceratobasidium sp. 428]